MPRELVSVPAGLPRQMVLRYLEKCRKDAAEVQSAVLRSDFGHVRIFGHRLRGTGAPYGFPALTEAGSAIESAATAHDSATLERKASELIEYLNRVELA